MFNLTRRTFMRLMGLGAGSAWVSMGVSACGDEDEGTSDPRVRYDHGVASGDPLADRVIIWTRVTPETAGPVTVMWQVATDEAFSNLVVQDRATTDASRDYTVKVDAAGLAAGTTYYYRFMVGRQVSPIGKTKTLPTGSVSRVKLLAFSCSNYPAGLFHAYGEAAKVADVDAALHLGDYIYEYDRSGYASADAATLGREVVPDSELFTLEDYRARYAQYRTDPDLQTLHAAVPFITVWDDHEVANDAYDGGAENHQPDEGEWGARLEAALQAYAEWMPLRSPVDTDVSSLQRNFEFGDLVNLIMADTRIVGRDQQINLASFFRPDGSFDAAAYAAAIGDPDRTILGAEQRTWLLQQLESSATWQVIGQQVLMGTMELPIAVLPTDTSDPSSAPLTFEEFALLAELAQIGARIQAQDPTVTAEEQAFFQANQTFFEENAALLTAGTLPYNLDAWDGYPVERATILGASLAAGNNLVVLAGDTHNSWANNLELQGTPAGVEFAVTSVSSPGLEEFLGVTPENAATFEQGIAGIIPGLTYTNLLERGFMTVTFTPADVTAEWTYIDTVKSATYSVVGSRGHSITVPAGANRIG